jgi:hypothetical protein
MHRIRWAPGLLGFISLAVGVQTLGCWPFDFEERAGTGGQDGAAGAPPVPPECVPSESLTPVSDACGVFVNTEAAAGGKGSKAAPLSGLQEAVTRASETGKRAIYLCAGQLFSGAVTVPAGIEIYGALECDSDWSYAPDRRSVLSAASDEIPLKITGGDGVSRLQDVEIVAESAQKAGGSSIALMVDGAEAELTRCKVQAKDGKDGESGALFERGVPAAESGNSGHAACSDDLVSGGAAKTNTCTGFTSVDSVGGSGGVGRETSGTPGDPGEPGGVPNGGAGQTATSPCFRGTQGADGGPGGPGDGARGLGRISSAGYSGSDGGEGKPGISGQGGGGGGASKGGPAANQCGAIMTNGGAGGGSGGPGGCGGKGGRGGKAGGSSIAIVSLNATLSFDRVELATGQGGVGGAGGQGQAGGRGGAGGEGGSNAMRAGLNPGCGGGIGGDGGEGGLGGGGLGGHSLGIAFSGKAPGAGATLTSPGTPGAGGTSVDEASSGAEGMSGLQLEIPVSSTSP